MSPSLLPPVRTLGAAIVTFGVACSSGRPAPTAGCVIGAIDGACTSCLQSDCGSQFGAVTDACRAYIACSCPGGSNDTETAAACETNDTSACASATMSLIDCSNASCPASCGKSGSSGAGGTDSAR